jgi:hypothetical protein
VRYFYEHIPIEMATERFKAAWTDWVNFRRERTPKVTEMAAKRQFAKLAEYPEQTRIDMIDQSIRNGWQGIFEMKQNFQRPAQTNNPAFLDANSAWITPEEQARRTAEQKRKVEEVPF